MQSYEFSGARGVRGRHVPQQPWVQVGFLSFDAAANPLTILTQPQNVQLGKQDKAGGQQNTRRASSWFKVINTCYKKNENKISLDKHQIQRQENVDSAGFFLPRHQGRFP